MKVMIFGASGMVGQGVLRECLLAADVAQVLCVGRASLGQQHAKLIEVVVPDLFDLHAVEDQLRGFDACFFCLGVSSSGMSEAQYKRLTEELTVSVASLLSRLNPQAMSFVYVSGAGTDSTERGRSAWARIKGATENALLRLPFKAAFMFRPGVIVPLDGIKSKTASYRIFYDILGPVLLALHRVMPSMTTTRAMGLAMLGVARQGSPLQIFDGKAINAVAMREPA